MDDDPHHLNDLHLCQECLAGDETAIAQLQKQFGPPVAAFLAGAGATAAEAAESVDSLWADLLAPRESRPPSLSLYRGASALQTWLNTVAFNKLLTRKRREQSWQNLAPARVDTRAGDESREASAAWMADPDAAEPEDVVLLELIREAIEVGIRECEPEGFVLLQLRHCDRLLGSELALMFDCDQPTITRRMRRARAQIEAATLMHLRRTDPWLELKWDDFIELCATATPACFGLD